MRSALGKLLIFVLLAFCVVASAVLWWLYTPIPLSLQGDAVVVELEVESGTRAAQIAADVAASGAEVNVLLLQLWFRFSGQARQIKAGSYEIAPGSTPKGVLNMLVRGDQSLRSVTLVEGWTFAQVRSALQKAELLTPESVALDPEMIMTRLGRPGLHPEGRFFPDTYSYAKGSSDLAVLKRAAKAMDKRLDAAWSLRSPDTPLKSPADMLILASIVEKETGKPSDRGQIAGVFANRLRINMRLQTDPTVIYGLGARFDGNLRKRDLLQDSPYNTYTRVGLPPTPIAMPGKAALLAAVQPQATSALYFVARGDGSSHFSATLDEHNKAVNKYIRNQ